MNGTDLVGRNPDRWIIDFATNMSENDAALYEAPFKHILQEVKEQRAGKREKSASKRWWLHQRSRPEFRKSSAALDRYIVTPRVGKYRLFLWLNISILPDSRLVAVCRDDDTVFGVLQSRCHEIWALRKAMRHGVRNDPQYTPTEGFETFPFPEGLTPNIPAAQYADDPRAVRIADVARRLNDLREAWLNPPDLVMRVPEVVPGYPDRILPVNEGAAKELKKRTLTKLYNDRPPWLDNIHRELDEAVAAAYGWPATSPTTRCCAACSTSTSPARKLTLARLRERVRAERAGEGSEAKPDAQPHIDKPMPAIPAATRFPRRLPSPSRRFAPGPSLSRAAAAAQARTLAGAASQGASHTLLACSGIRLHEAAWRSSAVS
jgi:hypothetical protein